MSLTHQQMSAFTELAKAGFNFFVQEHDALTGKITLSWNHGHAWALALAQYQLLTNDGKLCSLILITATGVTLVPDHGLARWIPVADPHTTTTAQRAAGEHQP